MTHTAKVLICALLLLSFAWAAPTPDADEYRPQVVYGGFAMVGPFDSLPRLYPMANGLQAELDAILYKRVQGLTPDHYDLLTTRLGDADKGDSLAVAFALDFERVSVERIAGTYKVLVEFSAQALVYDFGGQERSILASYPVRLPAYIEVFDHAPTSKDKAQLVRQFLLSGFEGDDSLLNEFLSVLKSAKIRQRYASAIGIGGILLADKAKQKLPAAVSADLPAFQYQIGRGLASELSLRQGVSVIPYQLDASVSRLAMRFTGEQSAAYLLLPRPDFVVDLAIYDFDRKVYSQSDLGSGLIYATYAQMRLRENTGAQQELFNQYISFGASKRVPESQDLVDHWAASLDSLWGLLNGAASQLNKPSRDWINSQSLTKSDLKEYNAFEEVLRKCR